MDIAHIQKTKDGYIYNLTEMFVIDIMNLASYYMDSMKRELFYNLSKPFSFLFNPEKDGRVIAMRNAFSKHGGKLVFKVSISKGGWVAECQDIKGIITGGINLNPSQKEIDREIKDAIYTAFGIPPHLSTTEFFQNAENQIEQPRVLHLGYGLAH